MILSLQGSLHQGTAQIYAIFSVHNVREKKSFLILTSSRKSLERLKRKEMRGIYILEVKEK